MQRIACLLFLVTLFKQNDAGQGERETEKTDSQPKVPPTS